MPRYQHIKLDTDNMVIEEEHADDNDEVLDFSEDDEINLSEEDNETVNVTEE